MKHVDKYLLRVIVLLAVAVFIVGIAAFHFGGVHALKERDATLFGGGNPAYREWGNSYCVIASDGMWLACNSPMKGNNYVLEVQREPQLRFQSNAYIEEIWHEGLGHLESAGSNNQWFKVPSDVRTLHLTMSYRGQSSFLLVKILDDDTPADKPVPTVPADEVGTESDTDTSADGTNTESDTANEAAAKSDYEISNLCSWLRGQFGISEGTSSCIGGIQYHDLDLVKLIDEFNIIIDEFNKTDPSKYLRWSMEILNPVYMQVRVENIASVVKNRPEVGQQAELHAGSTVWASAWRGGAGDNFTTAEDVVVEVDIVAYLNHNHGEVSDIQTKGPIDTKRARMLHIRDQYGRDGWVSPGDVTFSGGS